MEINKDHTGSNRRSWNRSSEKYWFYCNVAKIARLLEKKLRLTKRSSSRNFQISIRGDATHASLMLLGGLLSFDTILIAIFQLTRSVTISLPVHKYGNMTGEIVQIEFPIGTWASQGGTLVYVQMRSYTLQYVHHEPICSVSI